MRIVRLLVCTLSCVGFAPAASAELVRVPYTLVSLSPPPGFTATRAFGGFENRRAGWMIRVEELDPSEYPRLVAAFSSPERANELFGPDGVRIMSIEQLALDSGDVPLAIGFQKAFFGRELVKYMALMGGRGADRRPVVIMFNVSRSSTFGRSDVETVLRSVKIDDPPTLSERVAQLPFRFREVPPFHTTNAGSGWVWLAAFDDADQAAKKVLITIRRDPTVNRPAETAQMNANLVSGSINNREATIVEQRAEAFAGGPGDFIMASADGRTVFRFLRVLPNHTAVGFSAVGESRAIEEARAAVMEIARSVELRE
jgi:hypothetical protein